LVTEGDAAKSKADACHLHLIRCINYAAEAMSEEVLSHKTGAVFAQFTLAAIILFAHLSGFSAL